MQVGTTKDQGLYNKPSAAVHPGPLAAGTLPRYNTIHDNYSINWSPVCLDHGHIFTLSSMLCVIFKFLTLAS